MKSFIKPAYTFTPGASGVGTVNLSGITSFDVKRLVAIINQTTGALIYSTANPLLKFTTVAGTTVTLFFNTTGMSGADVLQVIYEDVGQAASAASSPMVLSTEQEALLGGLVETAPTTDTASSGLNGRLQRLAIRNSELIGELNETSPGTDTFPRGLNGRLQRVAQRITSLIALFPASLGQKTMANSFAITIASDQTVIPTSPSTPANVTLKQARVSLPTANTAVRATTDGSAVSSTRRFFSLFIDPDDVSAGVPLGTEKYYVGPSTVTTNGATTKGQQIFPGVPFVRENDAHEFYVVCNTSTQFCIITEEE